MRPTLLRYTRLMQIGDFFQRRLIVLSSVLIAGCGPSNAIRVGEPNQPVVVQAVESHAFSGATSLACPEYLVYFHQKLGDPVSARRTQLPLIGDRRPDGTVRVGLDYETDYEYGTAHEHFEWRITGNTVILTSYRVEADALSHRSEE